LTDFGGSLSKEQDGVIHTGGIGKGKIILIRRETRREVIDDSEERTTHFWD